MTKENWDVRIMARNQALLHFAAVEDNPGLATAHYFISFVNKPNELLLPPVEIPNMCLHVHDILPGQEGILFDESHAHAILDFANVNKIGEEFGRTLVQCNAGISRSSATAIALMVHGGFTYEEAFNQAVMVRPFIHPNKWMMEVYDRTLGKNGELLEYFKHWYRERLAAGKFAHVPPEKHYQF